MTRTYAALLFAAGKGTRMAPLTDTRPKPLITVAGRTLLDHALDLTNVPCIGKRVVNAHYKGAMIHDHLRGRGVAISDEVALLETGGGLRHALPLLGDGPVVTLNTDAVWCGPNPVQTLCAGWTPAMEALLLLVPTSRMRGHSGPGDFARAADGRLTRGQDYVYTGLQLTRTNRVHGVRVPAFSLNVIWDQMIAHGGLYGLVWDGLICDVGRPESIPQAEAMLKEHDV
ncbi:nucleotidyltransferase family protein [Loktanella sp. TSTF-M6]|uniref:Nucleotidyltransferase family protein n=1 Tax=Loktanella gaetbuli TaxID=2881335 RepID=A0ABS8BUN4_9RHOB|nr:nucleotidyltransferase family protein [Loktanella gaetbuli]MCB5199191.1 nucleotidyltransferase family protein [Loktanella gaetbuli]